MKRIQKKILTEDLKQKMVLLAGPRQSGKTWLSKKLHKDCFYLNWDIEDDKRIILDKSWRRDVPVVVLDELHKKPEWKSWLKGIVDKESHKPPLFVTGSAKMNIFRKGGDSLAGRYFLHRLFPFSIKELVYNGINSVDACRMLLATGGFPEPCIKGSVSWAKRWRKTHIERIITEDLLNLEKVNDIANIELLVDFLSQRVGTPVSYSSLARDLSVSPHTIKHWISILETLYVIFIVRPWSKKLQRTISKEPKIYFYDIGRISEKKIDARLKNLAALLLLKRQNYLEDSRGESNGVYYIRDREKRETDFLTTRDGDVEFLIEIKKRDSNLSKSLKYFSKRIDHRESFQLVYELNRPVDLDGIKIRSFSEWFSKLEA